MSIANVTFTCLDCKRLVTVPYETFDPTRQCWDCTPGAKYLRLREDMETTYKHLNKIASEVMRLENEGLLRQFCALREEILPRQEHVDKLAKRWQSHRSS